MSKVMTFLKSLVLIVLSTTAMTGFAMNNHQHARSLLLSKHSPVGYWKQIDDKSHQLESILQIWQHHDLLYARVIKTFAINGKKPHVYCIHCRGSLHGMKIVGMTVMWGLHRRGNAWINGRIVDPKTGKIYRCKLQLGADGLTLKVRGYIGFSLFGRTQVWQRTTLAAIKQLSTAAHVATQSNS